MIVWQYQNKQNSQTETSVAKFEKQIKNVVQICLIMISNFALV